MVAVWKLSQFVDPHTIIKLISILGKLSLTQITRLAKRIQKPRQTVMFSLGIDKILVLASVIIKFIFIIIHSSETNNWWFKYNEKQVGYWPSDIFELMKDGATMVQWGGEVYSPYLGTPWHTQTAMGNEKFSDFIFRNSGTMTGMLIEESFSLEPMITAKKISIPNPHAIKTIRVKDGDIVDCVDIYKQPAFDHPALKNHTIQFAVVLTEGFSYSGAKANIKVFNPYIDSIGDYSSSQVMLRNGPLRSFESAEAGWTVNPIVYNDYKTRLFAFWTVDGMQRTGCFDLTCPGFVQTSTEVLLGGDIGSYYASEITIQISKDPYTNNWWFKFNNKEVGYWPADIFELMRHQAVLVQWGGEVYSPSVGTQPHTGTAMGSGQFSDPISGTSGMMKGLLIEENSNPLKRPETLFVSSDEWNCYDAFLMKEYVPEPVFYYGGPGSRQNPKC
ncbi:hypothetical protein L1987_32100 [Smallanthus sonchifolius]|uniref:Uncharacterized protein n=1 Tax=Smallanthus sonchifolius TaxID=185202 RepID=A0ACB9I6S0_9ASTR|nr:hypothetical protein L1987_32100 [Smallanthus sonchifolius]